MMRPPQFSVAPLGKWAKCEESFCIVCCFCNALVSPSYREGMYCLRRQSFGSSCLLGRVKGCILFQAVVMQVVIDSVSNIFPQMLTYIHGLSGNISCGKLSSFTLLVTDCLQEHTAKVEALAPSQVVIHKPYVTCCGFVTHRRLDFGAHKHEDQTLKPGFGNTQLHKSVFRRCLGIQSLTSAVLEFLTIAT